MYLYKYVIYKLYIYAYHIMCTYLNVNVCAYIHITAVNSYIL